MVCYISNLTCWVWKRLVLHHVFLSYLRTESRISILDRFPVIIQLSFDCWVWCISEIFIDSKCYKKQFGVNDIFIHVVSLANPICYYCKRFICCSNNYILKPPPFSHYDLRRYPTEHLVHVYLQMFAEKWGWMSNNNPLNKVAHSNLTSSSEINDSWISRS